jgi:hypothetical protein
MDQNEGRIFHLAYYTDMEELFSRQKKNKERFVNLEFHRLRDCDSFLEICQALIPPNNKRGLRFAQTVINHPPESIQEEHKSGEEEYWKKLLKKGDILVQTTRPPLDDNKDEDTIVQNTSPPSGDEVDHDKKHKCIFVKRNWLETQIWNRLRNYFYHCSRNQVAISTELWNKISPLEEKWWKDILFKTHGTCAAKNSPKSMMDPPPSAAYFIYTKELWPQGPDLITTFGMCGAHNLLWAYLLRKKWSYFTEEFGFAMALLYSKNEDYPKFPVALSFSENFKIKIVTRILGENPSRMSAPTNNIFPVDSDTCI